MADTRGRGRATGDVFTLEQEAHGIADRLPELVLDASRIAATVVHGIHGRRRAGPGETFWQFRQFQSGEAARLIDWRRSASSDHLYVREREWEAAHTVWLWPDLSPSMNFKSRLSSVTKRDRALVVTFAAAELLVRGGERVALLGLTQPSASRKATTRMAEAIATHGGDAAIAASQPLKACLGRFSSALLVSDFLDPPALTREHVEALAGNGVAGHLVQVLDPAEETLPYQGRTEFLAMEGDERWLADRAETLRPMYRAKLEAHRAELANIAARVGWSLLVHHTDRPASELLLTLLLRMQAGGGGYRAASPAATEPRAGAGQP